jgi:hypothetical protein
MIEPFRTLVKVDRVIDSGVPAPGRLDPRPGARGEDEEVQT